VAPPEGPPSDGPLQPSGTRLLRWTIALLGLSPPPPCGVCVCVTVCVW
jgi:hypothetical protein